MKNFAWLYLIVFALLTPAFIYDMFARKYISYPFLFGLILAAGFYRDYIKNRNKK